MKWFRFYHEAYRNPKVQDLRPELFKFWVNFLCVASESETRGMVTSVDHLRRALGLRQSDVERHCRELAGARLLVVTDQGELIPHDWFGRQRASDDAAKRKRDERAKTYENGTDDLSRDMSRDVSRDKNVTLLDPPACAPDSDSEEKNPPSVGDSSLPPTPPVKGPSEGGATLEASPPPRSVDAGCQNGMHDIICPPLIGPDGKAMTEAEKREMWRRNREANGNFGMDEVKVRRSRQL